jgi:bacillithiol biosynthesis deacetylase BshB1
VTADAQPVDVLVLAAHPDDAEIGCGGTILRLTAAGRRVAVVDATRGEAATRGSPELRAAEADAASALLGLCARENLGLPDGRIEAGEAATAQVVEVLRRLRPRLLLAHLPTDVHPDHVAVAELARRAFFLAGLAKVRPEAGPPHRPRLLLRFFGNDAREPGFCVDVSAFAERKRAAVACYASQIPATAAERAHFVRGLDPIQRFEARDRWFGAQCGVAAAEPFVVDGPASLDELAFLLGDPR